MSELLHALRWELFKVRRLRLPWVVLGLLLLVVALHAGLTYRAYQDIRQYAAETVREAPPEWRQQRALQQEAMAGLLRANLVVPTVYGGVSGVLYFPGLVLVSAAAAWLVGTEFSWGTLQRQLARGRRRWVLVCVKLTAVTLLAALGVVGGLAAGSLAGVWTSRMVGGWRPEALSGQVWADLAVVALRLWAALSTYAVVAAAFGFLFRSAGLGIAAMLIFYLVDVLVASLIVQTRGWLSAVRPYLLSNLSRALVVDHNPFVVGLMASSRAFVEAPRVLAPSAAWLAMGGWAAVFVVLSFASFLRRDLQA